MARRDQRVAYTYDLNSCWLLQNVEGDPNPENDVEGAVEAVAVVRRAKEGSTGVHRAAVLAEIELKLRRHMLSSAGGVASASGRGEGAPSALAEAVLQGFYRLGHKISCAADLRCFPN